jgi:hypothetical protein
MNYKKKILAMVPAMVLGIGLTIPALAQETSGSSTVPASTSMHQASPTTDTGKNVTSPSTMGGSVTGSSGQPAIPGSTAGDSALNKGTSPSGGQPLDANANSAVQQRKANSLQNQMKEHRRMSLECGRYDARAVPRHMGSP